MSFICDNIFLGSLDDVKNIKFIKSNNIKTIIWLSDDKEQSFHSNKIKFFNFKVEDVITESNRIFNLCRIIYNILDTESGNIFVHCTEGVSRSPTIVIYYLMRKYDISFQKALEKVKDKRNIVNPNIGFQNILKKYENDIDNQIKLIENNFTTLSLEYLLNN
jgi:protein-tyrosine phosphatase